MAETNSPITAARGIAVSDDDTTYGPYRWAGGRGCFRSWGTWGGATGLKLKCVDTLDPDMTKQEVGADTNHTSAANGPAVFELDQCLLYVEVENADGDTALKFSIGPTGLGFA